MEQPAKMNGKVASAGILFFIILALFGGILKNPFIYDDYFFILANSSFKTTLNPLHYFTNAEASEPESDLGKGDQYRPLSSWLLALQFELGEREPFLFHAVSVVLHAVNAVLFFFILLLLFDSVPLAFAGAL
ncbi:MAG: hypothetical protein HYW88_00320, partial [Candidatus Sungbacteria bacterium]|nr:hypothetical protein [Candidatus Sungbacteria bacterium]